jgi:hypothetical protein
MNRKNLFRSVVLVFLLAKTGLRPLARLASLLPVKSKIDKRTSATVKAYAASFYGENRPVFLCTNSLIISSLATRRSSIMDNIIGEMFMEKQSFFKAQIKKST